MYLKILFYKIKRKLFKMTKQDFSAMNNVILKILKRRYNGIIDKYDDFSMDPKEVKYVWTMWLQGVENAPIIVKKSIESLKRNLPEEVELIILDENNLYDYIEFPSYIIEKYKKGIITKTHFSDLVRIKLLKEYGGIWMDSTVYISMPISYNELNQLLFTINEFDSQSIYVSKARWSGYLIGGRDLTLFNILDELLMTYWKENNKQLDYFLLDYFIMMVYEKNSFICQLVDSNYADTKILYLQQLLSLEQAKEEILQILTDKNNKFHKLSYKTMIYPEYLELLV